jgi:hypothetical protein
VCAKSVRSWLGGALQPGSGACREGCKGRTKNEQSHLDDVVAFNFEVVAAIRHTWRGVDGEEGAFSSMCLRSGAWWWHATCMHSVDCVHAWHGLRACIAWTACRRRACIACVPSNSNIWSEPITRIRISEVEYAMEELRGCAQGDSGNVGE